MVLLHLLPRNRTCSFVHATVRQTKGGGGVDGICSSVFVDRAPGKWLLRLTNASECLHKGILPFCVP